MKSGVRKIHIDGAFESEGPAGRRESVHATERGQVESSEPVRSGGGQQGEGRLPTHPGCGSLLRGPGSLEISMGSATHREQAPRGHRHPQGMGTHRGWTRHPAGVPHRAPVGEGRWRRRIGEDQCRFWQNPGCEYCARLQLGGYRGTPSPGAEDG